MAHWVTDLEDLPPEYADDIATAALRRARFTRDVVEAATSRDEDRRWVTAVRCIARVGRKLCRGRIAVVDLAERGEVEWECEACGESGLVTGVACDNHDLSDFHPCGELKLWGFDEEARTVLWEATEHIPELRAVIARARPHDEIPDLLVVEAAVEELDEVYTLVEELTDGTRSRRRLDLYDELRASLSVSMDGF